MSVTCLRAIARSRITLVLVIGFSSSIAAVGQSDSSIQAKLPEPPFELAIKADPVVALGSPVEMRIRITNTSTSEMHASAMHVHGGFAISYTYDIRDQSGNKLERKPFYEGLSASGPVFTLKPGQIKSEASIISAYYNLWPGKYTIQISKPASNVRGR